MESPADWGAFTDLCLEAPVDRPHSSRLRESVCTELRHLLGQHVRVQVKHGNTLTLSVDSNVSLALALDAQHQWRRLHLEGTVREGKLISSLTEHDGHNSSNSYMLLLERDPAGPFVERLPGRQSILKKAIPETLAKHVLSFLPEAWEVFPASRVVVHAEETALDHPAFQLMQPWPLKLDDWHLVTPVQATSQATTEVRCS
mmetsp:Transcript_44954/g.88977  ORF Transcript_44954/g.88977 Transcript_44954/m.88977 type:complete len:201 (+) Transcript_44954:114-716(+)|eukprot:CAMPEP_0172715126 /NCGR_PEP_ID=MMETSP1074-20121228/67366_1 /TAXON_ID=2916 /ORGANISM="Ceratium fusus, Strain PA161109" /LENGTH=200 /DNA_ID=CAMNT_0013539669 /DNA_START=109 /DNA_END=711 /DNA_ORIENTATION=-